GAPFPAATLSSRVLSNVFDLYPPHALLTRKRLSHSFSYMSLLHRARLAGHGRGPPPRTRAPATKSRQSGTGLPKIARRRYPLGAQNGEPSKGGLCHGASGPHRVSRIARPARR